jgi:hypothetical protein
MGGFESHKEYNRLLKNSADRQFSFLQKFQETPQKNTKNLRDNVTELLLWTVHPPSPVSGPAARAPVQDGAPALAHAPALARRLARGCAQEREGGGCQLVCG